MRQTRTQRQEGARPDVWACVCCSTSYCGLSGELRKGDGGVVEVVAEKALGERLEVFTGFGEGEGVGCLGPVEFEAGGLGGDPDLADGGVGGDDEFGGAVFEDDVHDAVVVFELEGAVVVLGCD